MKNIKTINELFHITIDQLSNGYIETHYDTDEISKPYKIHGIDTIIDLNKYNFWTLEWQSGLIKDSSMRRSFMVGYVERDKVHRLLKRLNTDYDYICASFDHLSDTSILYIDNTHQLWAHQLCNDKRLFVVKYNMMIDDHNLELKQQDILFDYGNDFDSIREYYDKELVDVLERDFIEVFIIDNEFKTANIVYKNILKTLKKIE